jgi:hypothetical protein
MPNELTVWRMCHPKIWWQRQQLLLNVCRPVNGDHRVFYRFIIINMQRYTFEFLSHMKTYIVLHLTDSYVRLDVLHLCADICYVPEPRVLSRILYLAYYCSNYQNMRWPPFSVFSFQEDSIQNVFNFVSNNKTSPVWWMNEAGLNCVMFR